MKPMGSIVLAAEKPSAGTDFRQLTRALDGGMGRCFAPLPELKSVSKPRALRSRYGQTKNDYRVYEGSVLRANRPCFKH